MSFQAYLDTFRRQTGKSPADFRAYAAAKGWTGDGMLKPEIKAGAIIADLKSEYGLGHGHAMAIFALLKGRKTEGEA